MSDAEQIVWQNTVDGGKWGCKVVRESDYRGRLVVWDVKGENVILDEPVGLSYGAVFGPDVDDVAAWQETVITAIDAEMEGRKAE